MLHKDWMSRSSHSTAPRIHARAHTHAHTHARAQPCMHACTKVLYEDRMSKIAAGRSMPPRSLAFSPVSPTYEHARQTICLTVYLCCAGPLHIYQALYYARLAVSKVSSNSAECLRVSQTTFLNLARLVCLEQAVGTTCREHALNTAMQTSHRRNSGRH